MSEGKEIVIRQPDDNSQQMNPLALIALAVQQGADVEKLTKLFELQERWENREAKKAFVNALSEFKKHAPDVEKRRQVAFGNTRYKFAALDDCCDKIGPALAEHGLSYTWKTENADKGIIRITCVLTHRLGHSEETSLQAVADQSGGKNAIQAIGSTITYLERYSLLAACGIAVQSVDDDGRLSDNDRLLTEAEVASLTRDLNSVKADWDKFLEALRVGNISELKLSQLARANEMIASKRKGSIK